MGGNIRVHKKASSKKFLPKNLNRANEYAAIQPNVIEIIVVLEVTIILLTKYLPNFVWVKTDL
jgi:hypothetical protein